MAGGKGGGQGGRGNKPGSHRKGAAVGSGGLGKQKLEGKKPTPPAELRKGHPKARKAAAAAKRAAAPAPRSAPSRSAARALPKASGVARKPSPDQPETVAGRNPVVESLRAKVPAMALYVALGNDNAYIEPVHLLAAMLRQDEGPRALLERAGVNVPGLTQAAEAAIKKLPQVQGG